MGVDIYTTYEGSLHCKSVHGPSNSILVTDAPVDNGGKGEAFSPTDLVATALVSCLITIMGLVAKRNNLVLEATTVHVVKEMTADPVRRIGSLLATVTVPNARNISAVDRTKLENAAKACPVKQSLHPDVKLTMNFVYVD